MFSKLILTSTILTSIFFGDVVFSRIRSNGFIMYVGEK